MNFIRQKWTMDQLQEAIHEEISHFQSRSTNQNNDEELTSTIDKLFTHDRPMENHHRVVIVDSTPLVPSSSKLQIDTTRLVEKKRKHRRKFFLFFLVLIKTTFRSKARACSSSSFQTIMFNNLE